jgi:hypothetical protein
MVPTRRRGVLLVLTLAVVCFVCKEPTRVPAPETGEEAIRRLVDVQLRQLRLERDGPAHPSRPLWRQ